MFDTDSVKINTLFGMNKKSSYYLKKYKNTTNDLFIFMRALELIEKLLEKEKRKFSLLLLDFCNDHVALGHSKNF